MAPSPDTGQEAATIRTLTRGDAGGTGRALAASHQGDPMMVHLFGDAARPAALRALFTASARDAAPFGASQLTEVDGRVVGAALWLPPGQFPMTARRKLLGGLGLLGLVVRHPRAIGPLSAAVADPERDCAQRPAWFLSALGLEPEAQGRGLGTRLLAGGLAAADAAGQPCHLETWKPANVAFYERLGFRVQREARPLGVDGPTRWTLRRAPAA